MRHGVAFSSMRFARGIRERHEQQASRKRAAYRAQSWERWTRRCCEGACLGGGVMKLVVSSRARPCSMTFASSNEMKSFLREPTVALHAKPMYKQCDPNLDLPLCSITWKSRLVGRLCPRSYHLTPPSRPESGTSARKLVLIVMPPLTPFPESMHTLRGGERQAVRYRSEASASLSIGGFRDAHVGFTFSATSGALRSRRFRCEILGATGGGGG